MPYALLLMLWISVGSLFLTVISGLHLFPTVTPVRLHVTFALTSITVALFAHTMTMFYFIGTSKKIKEFISEWDGSIQEKLRKKITFIKRKIFPGMTMVCVVLMVAFILGGAADARVVPQSIHTWTAYGALVYHVHVVVRETLYLFKNIALIDEVNDLARRRADSAKTGS